MRRAARIDDNHPEIVKAFEDCGCTVLSLAPMGRGVPDLLVGMDASKNMLVEVKDGSKAPSARKLTPDEQKFQKNWRGQWAVIERVEEVPVFVKAWRRL
jgi:hypothetical protein